MKINVVDIKGKNTDTLSLSFKKEGSIESIFRYIRVYLSNQRQGTSSTKTRAMVSGGGKKPWKQKGTGRARAGSTRSPLWVGGGRSHGPKPKSWRLALPKEVKEGSFVFGLNQFAENDNIFAVDFSPFKEVSTKAAKSFIKDISLENAKILFIHNDSDVLSKSFRNLKNVNVVNVKSVNSYNLMNAEKIVLDKESIEVLKERIK